MQACPCCILSLDTLHTLEHFISSQFFPIPEFTLSSTSTLRRAYYFDVINKKNQHLSSMFDQRVEILKYEEERLLVGGKITFTNHLVQNSLCLK